MRGEQREYNVIFLISGHTIRDSNVKNTKKHKEHTEGTQRKTTGCTKSVRHDYKVRPVAHLRAAAKSAAQYPREQKIIDNLEREVETAKKQIIEVLKAEASRVSTYKLQKAKISNSMKRAIMEKPESLHIETIINILRKVEKIPKGGK